MNFFLIRIAAFSSGLLLINFLMYSIVYNNYYKAYERIDPKSPCDTYILSDSHGLPLENKLETQGVYNFSAGSDSYADMYRKLKYVIKHRSIKRVLLTIDDQQLSTYREKANNLDRSAGFTNDVADFEGYVDLCERKFFRRYIPLLNPKSRDVAKQYLLSKTEAMAVTGENNWKNCQDKEALIGKRAKQQFPDKRPSLILTQYLMQIFTLCKQHNVTLVGIKYPLTNGYIDTIREFDYKIDSLFYSNGFKVFNYKYQFAGRDDYFKDQDHLNDSGSAALTKIMIHDLNPATLTQLIN